jgi:hypothetical protein
MIIGCIISEYDEYRIILNIDGKSGTLYITKRNIQSDQIDPKKQQEDFDNLVQDWRGDQYLLEKTREGVYVKDRKLSHEGGMLVWKEVNIFSDFRWLFRDMIMNDTMRICFGKEETVVTTNGELIRTKDSTFVQWPLTMKEFTLKIQRNNFKPTSGFASKFKIYTRKEKK